MKLYHPIAQKLIFPLVTTTTKRKFWRLYQAVRKTQYLSKEELSALQLKKLRALLEHAYENVPYYFQLFKKANLKPSDIKTLSDLEKLPVTTKADLREAGMEKTSAKNHKDFQTYKDSTSGSTGQPFQFLGEVRARDYSTAYTLRSWNWGGYEVGDPYLSLWGWHKYDWSNKLFNKLMRNIYISAYDLDHKFDDYVKILRSHKPKLLTAYTSSMVKMAKMMQAAGIDDITVPIMIPTSENLYPHLRQLLEETFHGKVYDRYGSRELGAVAGECQNQDGLHINAETFIVEYVKTEQKVESGAKRLVITHLDKFGMPLIRYDTGDLGTPGSDKPCSCGLRLPKIGSIDGRVTDFIKMKNGVLVPYFFFNYSLEQYGPYIRQFQLSQPNLERLILKVVPTQDFSEDKQKELIERLEKALDHQTKVEIVLVKEIPLAKSGKFVTVSEKVPF